MVMDDLDGHATVASLDWCELAMMKSIFEVDLFNIIQTSVISN